ncbi:MAG: ABC transporter ATP-binding protein [Peptoniphilaceae bacterium]|uniref:ABC transporter ATP-binding protein n=1 Tax=Parvimonas sp. TaxID=1944660 RepID=UPI0025EDFE8E|nr:ABC transporter ATP-binding protein [Parvimonas sp.]MCI5998056.1 ABC transporter ATP-binding protein/permease [Parvimonas sp.]MDD7764991.1 ABC transporter ATP-binding protein [Peptoniphilaceae bacterium]MDY3050325.1 ABC transporter ATP-binding protein [Parvimonas sp.]
MSEIKLFWKILKNNRFTYFLSMISTIFIQIFSGLTPIVIMVTVDSIIGDKEYKYSVLKDFVEFLGGREYLRHNIYLLAVVIVVLTFISCIFIFLRNYYSNLATENLIFELRKKIYNKFLVMDLCALNEYSTGDLIQRSSSDIETLRKLFATQLVNAFGSAATIILVMFVMAFLNLKLALISISICVVIAVLSYIFYEKVSLIFQKTDEAESELVVFIKEVLFNIRVVKAFDREDYVAKKFVEKNEKFNFMQNSHMRTFARFRAINDFLTFLQVAVILIVGGYETIIGKMNFGDLVAFVIYINMIVWPIRQIGQLLNDMAKAKVSIFRIFEIFDLKEEDYTSGEVGINLSDKIEFKNVSLDLGDGFLLKDINFVINKGESLGIIGATGSGKSLLVYLLLGFFKATSGQILINDVDINDLNKKYIREKISAVLQDSELFNLSILDNIKITNESIKDSTVFESANISSIHDEILNFTFGYNTVVVDNGVNLSGGQKQRISISRGLVKDFDVLILDDSLSAVDMNTDLKINNSLKTMKRDFISIIISHRVSTISGCDNILVMDNGKIIEKGNHDELLRLNGVYSKLNEIQSKEYVIDNE